MKSLIHLPGTLARSLARVWSRHPTLCGLAIGAALVAAVLAFAPAYAFLFSDPWMLAILGGLTLLVAVVARARSRDEDEW